MYNLNFKLEGTNFQTKIKIDKNENNEQNRSYSTDKLNKTINLQNLDLKSIKENSEFEVDKENALSQLAPDNSRTIIRSQISTRKADQLNMLKVNKYSQEESNDEESIIQISQIKVEKSIEIIKLYISKKIK